MICVSSMSTSQSKLSSFLESVTNTVAGFGFGLLTQILTFKAFDIDVPLTDNFAISLIFAVVSVARSYVIRRWFNKRS